MAAAVFVGTIETSNFSFLVVSETAEAAYDALGAAWKQHATETGAAWGFDDLDIQIERREVGVAYRDGEPIHG